MASIANWTLTTDKKPSVFEILAQNAMHETVPPSFERLLEYLHTMTKSHWICGPLFGRFREECTLFLHALLQYNYVKNFDGTFAECFYGLKRTTLFGTEISKMQRVLTYLVAVFGPYVNKQMDKKVETMRYDLLENSTGFNVRQLLIHAYAVLRIFWSLGHVTLLLRYMLDKNNSQLPALQILKLCLVYETPMEKNKISWKLNSYCIKNALFGAFEIWAFLQQFLYTYRATVNASSYVSNSVSRFGQLPPIPPPPRDTEAALYANKCPICMQAWRIPTMLPVSGYVFCLECIAQHLSGNKTPTCPVTNLPANIEHLVRVFDTS